MTATIAASIKTMTLRTAMMTIIRPTLACFGSVVCRSFFFLFWLPDGSISEICPRSPIWPSTVDGAVVNLVVVFDVVVVVVVVDFCVVVLVVVFFFVVRSVVVSFVAPPHEAMLCCWLECQRMLYHEFLEAGTTVTALIYKSNFFTTMLVHEKVAGAWVEETTPPTVYAGLCTNFCFGRFS